MSDVTSTPSRGEEQLWDRVVNRQRADADSGFFYAVTTMGIYCRPGCPSPRPLRHNVRFFFAIEDAEEAGFRACKRCDPKGERARIAREVVEDACAYIEQTETIPSLEILAKRAGYSRFHFLRMFKDHAGLTPRSYAEGVRAKRLSAALSGGKRVVDAVVESGFGSESRVYERTNNLLGMTPGKARRGGDGETIRVAAANSIFGRVLIGATTKGVCFLGFSEPEEALLGDLCQRFPRAKIVQDEGELGEWLQRVIDYLQEPKKGIDLPLDLRGTVFQQRVWNALRQIPPGETRSYRDLAAMVGDPRAVRAVARTCAVNPVSLVVPCHRVIGSNGDLTGYRWGIANKRSLLAGEAEVIQKP